MAEFGLSVDRYVAQRRAEAGEKVGAQFQERVGFPSPPPAPRVGPRAAYEPLGIDPGPVRGRSDGTIRGEMGARLINQVIDGVEDPMIFNPDSEQGRAWRARDNGGGNSDPSPTPSPEPSVTSRNVDRNGAKGTQTSPSAAKPGDLDAFSRLLGSKYGIQFRGGFESNKLPTGSGYSVDDEVAMGGNVEEAQAKQRGGFVETVIDGNDVSKSTINRGEVAEGPQKGTSAVPDVGDQQRAVPVKGFNGAVFGGEEPNDADLTGGISARSRAFLDHDGDSLMALRAAEASQGYIRQGGKNYGITGEEGGKRQFQEFNDDGRKALVKDGNAVASQEFLKKYMMGETNAKAAENPAVESPVETTSQQDNNLANTNSAFGPMADTETYGKQIDAQRGMTGMGPLANGELYGSYLDGREPLMRDPRNK